MRETKTLEILMTCMLVLLLAVETGFISVAWAEKGGQGKKPPGKQETRIEPGYIIFRDDENDAIQSDDGNQYVDRNIINGGIPAGLDQVDLEIHNEDNTLRRVELYLGRMMYPDPAPPEGPPPSDRRVHFCFDIHSGAETPECQDNRAVYNILMWYKEGDDYKERCSENPGYLDDDSVHATIMVDASGKGRIQFVVDPDNVGTDLKAITQDAVDAYYDGDENVNYWDTSEYGEWGQVIYTLYYGETGFSVVPIEFTPIDPTGSQKPVTWSITANLVTVKLGVGSYGNRPSRGAHKIVYLSEFNDELPLGIIVSLNNLQPSGAPQKHNILTATWGKIKGK